MKGQFTRVIEGVRFVISNCSSVACVQNVMLTFEIATMNDLSRKMHWTIKWGV